MRQRTVRARAIACAAAVVLAACTSERSQESQPAPSVPAAVVAGGDWLELSCKSPRRHIERIKRGYFPGRSPDVTMTPKAPNLFASPLGTTHSGPWDYLQDVPLVFFGPGSIARNGRISLERESSVADIAPTIAELIDTPFPEDRAGEAITEAIEPGAEAPKLVIVMVIDGGGWNVLNEWPDAWPFLRSLMERGTTITNATVGSSPSVTPAVHASIGTGTLPDQHGVVDIFLRHGDVTSGSYPNDEPRYLRVPTLADLYDQAMGNRPKMAMVAAGGWHLGMLGRGAKMEGGDKDIAVLEGDDHEPDTNTELYSLPDYLDEVPGIEEDIRTADLADGELDERWLGRDVLTNPETQGRGPVRTLFQTRQIKALIANEGLGADAVPDLVFTNYKQVDVVGHVFNMVNPEMESILQLTDSTIKDLVGFLDDEVGKNEWAMAITADHGQGPATESTGGFPIDIPELRADVASSLGKDEEKLFAKWRPTGYWLHPDLPDIDATAERIADVIAGYRASDARGGEIPDHYEGRPRDRLFESAFPMARIDDVLGCISKR